MFIIVVITDLKLIYTVMFKIFFGEFKNHDLFYCVITLYFKIEFNDFKVELITALGSKLCFVACLYFIISHRSN